MFKIWLLWDARRERGKSLLSECEGRHSEDGMRVLVVSW